MDVLMNSDMTRAELIAGFKGDLNRLHKFLTVLFLSLQVVLERTTSETVFHHHMFSVGLKREREVVHYESMRWGVLENATRRMFEHATELERVLFESGCFQTD